METRRQGHLIKQDIHGKVLVIRQIHVKKASHSRQRSLDKQSLAKGILEERRRQHLEHGLGNNEFGALVRNHGPFLKKVRCARKPSKRFGVLVAKPLGFDDASFKRGALGHIVQVLDEKARALRGNEPHHAHIVLATDNG